ncbi:MAG TPA: glycosyltransferase [Caulobacterales bacterium]|nr:glycosyltransferase [Caulobacterales bacterium]
MISVIIPSGDDPAHLPRALAPLVAGVADGLVREAIVVDDGAHPENAAIAEAAGCTLVHAPGSRARRLIAGAKAARGDWFLFLQPDTFLCDGWLDETRRFVRRPGAQSRAGTFRLGFEEETPLPRRIALSARLRTHMFGLPYDDQGLLISRRLYDMTGGHHDMDGKEIDDLSRRIGRKRLTLLRSELIADLAKHERRRAAAFARYFKSAKAAED